MEYIIKNVTNKEQVILEDNNVDWFIDDLNSRDIIIDNEIEYNRTMKLLNRK
jgi:hypothetical protein